MFTPRVRPDKIHPATRFQKWKPRVKTPPGRVRHRRLFFAFISRTNNEFKNRLNTHTHIHTYDAASVNNHVIVLCAFSDFTDSGDVGSMVVVRRDPPKGRRLRPGFPDTWWGTGASKRVTCGARGGPRGDFRAINADVGRAFRLLLQLQIGRDAIVRVCGPEKCAGRNFKCPVVRGRRASRIKKLVSDATLI